MSVQNRLDCSHNPKITDNALIAQLESSIVEIHLKGCCEVTDDSLLQIARRCPGLQILDITFRKPSVGGRWEYADSSKVTDRSIEAIAKGCRDLRYLTIACRQGLTDVSLQAIAANCPQLEELDVAGCLKSPACSEFISDANPLDFPPYVPNMTQASIEKVTAQCTHLKQKPRLTEASFEAFGGGRGFILGSGAEALRDDLGNDAEDKGWRGGRYTMADGNIDNLFFG